MPELNLNSKSNISDIEKYEKELNKGTWLNRYYAELCPYCVEMAHEWKKFISQKKKVNIKIASVEESAFNQLKNQPANIQGFPTITITYNGKLVSEFNGKRTCQNFQKFINNNCQNCQKVSSKSTLKKNVKGNKKRNKNSSLSRKKN